MSSIETVRGIIKSIIYKNDTDGFIICSLDITEKKSEIIKGYLTHLKKGEEIIAQGNWEIHQKFGKQFLVSSFQRVTPKTKEGLVAYLGSGLIKGIGPSFAQKLVDAFGTKVLDVIEHESDRLLLLPGIGKNRQEQIVNSFVEQKAIAHIMLFLQEKGISSAYALKIFKTYQEDAINIIEKNPYQLAEDVWGIGFKIADDIAQKCGISKTAPQRIAAGIMHILSTVHTQGSVYQDVMSLEQGLIKLLEVEKSEIIELFKEGISFLKNCGKIKSINYQEKEFLTTRFFYYAEQEVAHILHTLLSATPNKKIFLENTHELTTNGFFLAEKQIDGIKMILEQGVSIITGGPGTGKTTLIKTLLSVLQKNRCSYILAAPTGRAAKRIMESTGYDAVTIHRLLEFDPVTKQFNKNKNSPLKTDVIIVDEASMIDLMLVHALLRAISLGSKIVFIGDIDQLPSVGPGNILADMINSGVIPYTRLDTIFRQSEQSMIVINAHRINEGKFPFVSVNKNLPEFLLIEEHDATKLPHHLSTIFSQTLKQYTIFADQTIILTPMHKGTAGTTALNIHMQHLLNSAGKNKPGIAHFGITYLVGDYVMQLRNNYDKMVFNGDIGVIEVIDKESEEIAVRFLDRLILYELHEIQELTLAYAISIHKSQGSEYQAVIVPLFMQHFMLLQKNLLYTALTRAKKLCIFIGEKKAISMALNNTKGSERVTFLKEYLKQKK